MALASAATLAMSSSMASRGRSVERVSVFITPYNIGQISPSEASLAGRNPGLSSILTHLLQTRHHAALGPSGGPLSSGMRGDPDSTPESVKRKRHKPKKNQARQARPGVKRSRPAPGPGTDSGRPESTVHTQVRIAPSFLVGHLPDVGNYLTIQLAHSHGRALRWQLR